MLQLRYARERPGQDVEGAGYTVAHGKGPSPGVGCQPRHLHALEPVSVHVSKARHRKHVQLR